MPRTNLDAITEFPDLLTCLEEKLDWPINEATFKPGDVVIRDKLPARDGATGTFKSAKNFSFSGHWRLAQ